MITFSLKNSIHSWSSTIKTIIRCFLEKAMNSLKNVSKLLKDSPVNHPSLLVFLSHRNLLAHKRFLKWTLEKTKIDDICLSFSAVLIIQYAAGLTWDTYLIYFQSKFNGLLARPLCQIFLHLSWTTHSLAYSFLWIPLYFPW